MAVKNTKSVLFVFCHSLLISTQNSTNYHYEKLKKKKDYTYPFFSVQFRDSLWSALLNLPLTEISEVPQ